MAVVDPADINIYHAPSRRRAIFEIDPQILVALFAPGHRSYTVIENGIPADAVVYGVSYDMMRQAWLVGVEHESFPECPELAIPITLRPAVAIADVQDVSDV